MIFSETDQLLYRGQAQQKSNVYSINRKKVFHFMYISPPTKGSKTLKL